MRPGVYVTEAVLPTPTNAQPPSVAAGALVANLPSGPTTPTLVTSWYAFTRTFGDLNKNYDATFAANMFFRSGGRELYVSRVVRSDASKAVATLKAADTSHTWMTFTAKSEGAYGNGLRIKITKNNGNGLYNIQVLQDAGVTDTLTGSTPDKIATAGTTDDVVLEAFYDVDLATQGNAQVVTMFSIESQFIDVAWVDVESTIPTEIGILALSGGDDGTSTTFNYADAITNLGAINRSFVVFSPGTTDNTTVSALVAFAEANGSFVVLDTDSDMMPDDAVTYAGTVGATSYAAVYYPHIWIPDTTQVSRSAIRKVPPSGAVAGTILATDAGIGVFKAPAGLQTTIPGVVALEKSLTSAELDALNNDVSPVNALRVVSGSGAVIMGARTLNQAASTRYINVRRTLLFLEKELKSRLEFALFRNNDKVLRGQITTAIDAFLNGFWNAGGLRGANRNAAYFIKCDAENNTSADIANGIVNVQVGVALQFPAEFINIQLTQQTQA
jgi:hypothetical protein